VTIHPRLISRFLRKPALAGGWQISLARSRTFGQYRQGTFQRRILPWNQRPRCHETSTSSKCGRRIEGILGQVADAINEAPPGQIISGSEEKVRDLFAALCQRAYEKGVQMRINTAEAALPPPKDASTGKTKRNKGRQEFRMLTINGRVQLWRGVGIRRAKGRPRR
jgi:hypothetical protein